MNTAIKAVIIAIVAIVVIFAASSALLFSSMFSVFDSINELNMEDATGDKTKAMFKEYPESVAFLQKHPDLTSEELYNLGLDYEYSLITDDASLRIDYNKETGESSIIYICDLQGNPQSYDGEDLKDVMMTLC